MILPKLMPLQHFSAAPRSSHSVTGVTAVKLRHAALLYVNIAAAKPGRAGAQMCVMHPTHRYILNTKT